MIYNSKNPFYHHNTYKNITRVQLLITYNLNSVLLYRPQNNSNI